ncbi:hypothetical protein NDU88_008088 [Pleurodeles waltl]|uniref:Uncharacterized protein n=1 Tax=Pleurodeles waltl TaxID=8319 RepID=A0AAV7N5B8_PLEWA|nr:hypothetical protein NDU88_008088 [Pleurodeles waltl]
MCWVPPGHGKARTGATALLAAHQGRSMLRRAPLGHRRASTLVSSPLQAARGWEEARAPCRPIEREYGLHDQERVEEAAPGEDDGKEEDDTIRGKDQESNVWGSDPAVDPGATLKLFPMGGWGKTTAQQQVLVNPTQEEDGEQHTPGQGDTDEASVALSQTHVFGQGTEIVSETEDNNRETSEKKSSPSAGNKQFQVQQFDQLDQLDQPTHQSGEGAAGILRPAMEGEDLHKSSASPKKLGKIIGKDPQFVDWGKDNRDKFYSLTEESDLSSGDHSFGGSDDSETSEAENKSSSNEPTVRQLRRQRKSVKSRPSSQEGLENSTSTGGRTLKWDYSVIGLADSSTISNQGLANGNKETDTGPPIYNSSTMGTDAGMLKSIYSSIKELQTETRIESRRARIATKGLQGTVRKVAKSCT